MDIADKAEQSQLVILKYQLAIRKETAPEATGFCFNCDTPLPDGRRWCGAECRDDWQAEFNRGGNGG